MTDNPSGVFVMAADPWDGLCASAHPTDTDQECRLHLGHDSEHAYGQPERRHPSSSSAQSDGGSE